jgi:predicted enzyme related to lactoylglutathione lyase
MADSLLGRVLWYELLTTDMKAAEQFYTKVVGWTVSPFQGGSPGAYDVFQRDGDVGVGGVMTIPDGMGFPPHWGMYVSVPKLEDAVARIESLGGSALSEVIEVPEVGRMRTMKDPQGTAFSILEPSMPGTPGESEPQIGDASWHELYTTDAEAAMKFYTEVFGWEPTESMDMGPMGKYHMFGRGRGFGGGMMNKPAEMAQVPPHWGFYFRVPDVHQGAERVKAAGGQVLNGPMEVPGGDWVVNCMDPQGAAFSLHHKKKN